jgi:hypothetical protein
MNEGHSPLAALGSRPTLRHHRIAVPLSEYLHTFHFIVVSKCSGKLMWIK